MKTLIISIDPAYPPVSGGDLRNWQNAQAASLLGPVLLASIGIPRSHCDVPSIEICHFGGIKSSTVWGSDFNVTFPEAAERSLRDLCDGFQPDVIILESLSLVNLVGIAKKLARHVILDLHNVESDLILQNRAGILVSWFRWRRQERAAKIRKLEQAGLRFADRIWVCSTEDRDMLASFGEFGEHIFVVPNGIPEANSSLRNASVEKRSINDPNAPRLLFLGHLGYFPNVEAAIALGKVLRLLRTRLPNAHLTLAGRNPDRKIVRMQRLTGIDVIENPSSVEPLLAGADIAVLPIVRGGGTRIKVLEAIAWGLPIVATEKAVEGLNLQNLREIRIAHSTLEFASAIEFLAKNPAEFELQRMSALKHVLGNFGPAFINHAVKVGLSF